MAESDSPLVTNPEWWTQAVDQAEAVLNDTEAHLDGQGAVFGAPELIRDSLSAEIGRTRAATDVHPVDSLQAAVVFFEVAIRELAPPDDSDPEDVVAVGNALHRAIIRRIVVASLSYSSFLLRKVHNSHLEERNRMARELHDRAAHGIGLGLQNLELHKLYAGTQPELAAAKLDTARATLQEALVTVRALSAELRRMVGDEGLAAALRKYLHAIVSPKVTTKFIATGNDLQLPSTHSEEVYLVLREAVRNALVHADPTSVVITITVEGGYLRGTVQDNGTGFDVDAAVEASAGVGLNSMRERLELLGGELRISSSPEEGTEVAVKVRLPVLPEEDE